MHVGSRPAYELDHLVRFTACRMLAAHQALALAVNTSLPAAVFSASSLRDVLHQPLLFRRAQGHDHRP